MKTINERSSDNFALSDFSKRREVMLNTLARNDPDAWVKNFDPADDEVLDPFARAAVTARRKQMQPVRVTYESSIVDSWDGPSIAHSIPGVSA